MSGNEIIDKKELNSVVNIFKKSNGVLFAHGFEKRRKNIFRTKIFENNFKNYLKINHAVSCSSGTAAGVMCLRALGIKEGDEVIVPSFTFIAAVEAIIEVGAIPIIVDSDISYNMCPIQAEKKINKKTKCIMLVHMLGVPSNIDKFLKLKKKYNLKIIEDACESLGAEYKNKKIGTFGDASFFSFDFAKIITTGEGGMCVTDSKRTQKMLQAIRDHGHENKNGLHRGLDKAIVRGFNFRMSELQAAVGIEQLKKIKKILLLKKKNYTFLEHLFNKNFNQIKIRYNFKFSKQLYDFLVIQFKNNKIASKAYSRLNKAGISTGILPVASRWHYAGYWKHIFKDNQKFKKYNLKTWKNSWGQISTSLSLPISIIENSKDLKIKFNKIKKILNNIDVN
tara:strand:+ start:87 stop:1268 length:1182 start_codon:yes stop_codon:yes gene_type:complete